MAQITISDDLIALFKCEYAERTLKASDEQGLTFDECQPSLENVQSFVESLLRRWIDEEHDIPLTFMEGDRASIAEWVESCRAKAAANASQKAALS